MEDRKGGVDSPVRAHGGSGIKRAGQRGEGCGQISLDNLMETCMTQGKTIRKVPDRKLNKYVSRCRA